MSVAQAQNPYSDRKNGELSFGQLNNSGGGKPNINIVGQLSRQSLLRSNDEVQSVPTSKHSNDVLDASKRFNVEEMD